MGEQGAELGSLTARIVRECASVTLGYRVSKPRLKRLLREELATRWARGRTMRLRPKLVAKTSGTESASGGRAALEDAALDEEELVGPSNACLLIAVTVAVTHPAPIITAAQVITAVVTPGEREAAAKAMAHQSGHDLVDLT